MSDFLEGFLIVLRAIALLCVVLFLGAWIVMLLWNGIVVTVFGLPALTYWQTYGLIIMIRIILPRASTVSRKKD